MSDKISGQESGHVSGQVSKNEKLIKWWSSVRLGKKLSRIGIIGMIAGAIFNTEYFPNMKSVSLSMWVIFGLAWFVGMIMVSLKSTCPKCGNFESWLFNRITYCGYCKKCNLKLYEIPENK